jgi:predicted amidohydrolase
MENLRISLVQSNLYWEDIDKNLQHFNELTQNVETDVLVLPEMFTTGFTNSSEKLAVQMDSIPVKWMQDLSIKLDALVIGSMIILENGMYYNRLIAAFPDGTLKTYDKRHLFSLVNENDFYSAGLKKTVIDYKEWKISPLICYDLRFPAWCRNTDMEEVILFVANWPEKRQKHWNLLLNARAIENQSYVVGVNRIGEDANGIPYNGRSAAYDFWGNEMILANDLQGIFTIEIFKNKLKEHRQRFGFWRDRDTFEIQ